MIQLFKISLLPRGWLGALLQRKRNESVMRQFQAFWDLECWEGIEIFPLWDFSQNSGVM